MTTPSRFGYQNYQERHPMIKARWLFTGGRTTLDNILISSHITHSTVERAHFIITDEEDIKAEEEYIRSSLKKCGYPNWSFKKTWPKGGENQQSKKTQQNKQPNQKRTLVTIPYKESSEALQRIFQKYKISTALKPHTKLRNMLVHPKDRRSIHDKTGIVYQIPCGSCDKSYIGETARKFGTRKNEHQPEVEAVGSSYFTRRKRKSPILTYTSQQAVTM